MNTSMIKRKLLVLLLAGFVLIMSMITVSLTQAQASSGNDRSDKPIRLISGNYYPEIVSPTEAKAVQEEGEFNGRYFKLIQFHQLPTDAQRAKWEKEGMYLVDYLPDDTYFAVIDQNFNLNQLTSEAITIIETNNLLKVESELVYQHAQGFPATKLVLSYYETLDAKEVIADLESMGVIIEAHRDYSRQLDVVIEPSQFGNITALPYIQFVGAEPAEGVPEPYYHNSTGRSNYLNTGYNGLNYNGDGVVIAVGEGGTADNRIDFRGRLIELSSGGPGGHKISVLQHAASGGNLDPADQNNAWGATLLSTGGSPDYVALYNSHDLRFTNHSLGYGISGGYDNTARNHDLRTAAYPNHLVSYSAGNSGGATGFAPYDGFSGWANITGQRKQNKTEFAIGALNTDDDVTGFSSRGPTYDGRVYPQLIIEGSGGTSHASPKIVGLMAILSQAYQDINGAEPTAHLLRAILMNTADEVDNPGPDFKSGYGRPNMRRAYNVITNTQYFTNTVSTGITNTHTLVVPAGTNQVRVMLMWPDAAASIGANPAIVNDLNILLTDPASTTSYNPWVLDHTPNPINLDTPATRQIDNLNTMEQVTIDSPSAGNWTISVGGANIPLGPQEYYIVYEFLTDELHMAFPLVDEQFVPGDTYRLKWDSYGTVGGTFTLDYRIDSGSWINIITGYDADSRNYEWTAPTVTGIHAITTRIQRGGFSVESGVNYIGDVPQTVAVDWACDDELQLSWGSVDGADSYSVYRLGSKYMETMTTNITFNGTSAILTGLSTTEDEYFAVSSLTGVNEGLRTNALTKMVGNYNCFNAKTTIPSSVDKTDVTLNGLVNPHGTTITNVHFEYGSTTAYGSSTAVIPTSATGHTEEAVSSAAPSALSSRTDVMHYRLVATVDGTDAFSDDQEIRLAPGNNYEFDGIDGYLDISSNPNLPIYTNGTGNSYSISMWVNGPAEYDVRVYSEGSNSTNTPVFLMGSNAVGHLRMYVRDDNGTVHISSSSTTVVFDDSWHHIVWTDDNGDVTLYIDGAEDSTDFDYTPSSISMNQAAIGAVLRSSSQDYFTGEIDEVSLWSKALTIAEVRDLLHQPLNGDEADLGAYFPFDGRINTAFDVITNQELQIIGGANKITSTAPFGIGTEFTANETTGVVTFTGTDFTADYSSQNDATVIVSKIEIEPNSTAGFPVGGIIFDNQYWVVHRHGSGTFSADVTFTISEDLTAADEGTTGQIHLFGRDKGSDGDWAFIAAANSVVAATEQATFDGISTFDQQFIISRNTDPFISTSESMLPFRNVETGSNYQQYSYDLLGINLTANLDVTAPAGFLISTDANSGFVTALSLPPTSGSVSETIYVRFTPSSAGPVSGGDVIHSSAGATSTNVTISQFEVFDVADYATQAMTFDGSNDYLDVQNFDWNPNSVFTVEWWLKPNGHASWDQQVGNGWGNFLFHTNSNGMISAGVANNSNSRINSANGVLIVGDWQHFAFTLNGSAARFYRNGELIGEQTSSDGINSNWGHFDIGKNGGNTVNGQIDEFRIWSTARTQQEIKNNMHNVLAGDETDLELYLQFNAETGDVVDFSDNGYAVNSYNGVSRSLSTASVGTVGEFVETTTPTVIGDAGKQLEITITSTPDDDNYAGIYSVGSGTNHYFDETYPTGVNRRSNILWGIQEFGDVTVTLVFDYSNVTGADTPATIKLLKRADAANIWTDVTGDFTHDTVNHTFTRTGITDFSEFSIGGDGSDNPLAINLASVTSSNQVGYAGWMVLVMVVAAASLFVVRRRLIA